MAYRSCEPLRVWNRLEPRPRQVELDRVLQARVHDALWMLTRQWQFGEFHAEDTGSPVLATIARRTFPVSKVRLGAGPAAPYDPDTAPLEPLVERLPVTFTAAMRAAAGSYLLTLLSARLAGEADAVDVVAAVRAALAGHYRLRRLDLDPSDETHALSVARRRSGARADRVLRGLAGRAVDGVALAQSLPATVTWASVPGPVALAVPTWHADTVLGVLQAFRDWFATAWSVPAAGSGSWDSERLEYDHGATVARGGGVELIGAPSSSGRLDWYSFDLAPAADTGTGPNGAPWQVARAIPTPAEYAGMPAARWWQLEDSAVSLSGLRADAGDLAKLLVTEFALVYGNNWLLVPYEQPVGTLCEVAGIVVNDVFGVRTLVEPATGSAGAEWDSWDLFSLSPRRPGPHPVLGQHLFLPPALPSSVDGPVLEEVVLLRDEMSNLVWAVESRVPDGVGGSRDGAEAARGFAAALAVLQAALAEPESAPEDTGDRPVLTYRLATTVPGNWIPYLPVHRPESQREIRLQRASMPRYFPAGSPRVRPVTSILRAGLADPGPRTGRYPDLLEDGDPQLDPAFVNEEEVPRSGVVVRGRISRARWSGGKTLLWHGRRVTSGRGEGSSGLVFDAVQASDEEVR